MNREKLVVFTGAGVSTESGLATFRGAGGLWAGHKIEEVASPEGWYRNMELVLKFYNERRSYLIEAEPNAAHTALAELEAKYDVWVITQNVDDLHERGGSSNVVHLHGELLKSRSTSNPFLVYDCREDINVGDTCEEGSQLRPHIVWFGEAVPMLEKAVEISAAADQFIVIGTSLQVYPAASLIEFVRAEAPKFLIDPHPAISEGRYSNLKVIAEKATIGVRQLVDELMA